jgi:CubicO group peptidase (beta-lactamase class C family)
MKSKFITSLLLISIFFINCQGQGTLLTTGIPENVGMSYETLTKIDELVEKYIADGKVPGGSFLVAKEGKIVYEYTVGHRTSKNEVPYQSDDIYRIASMTKAVTCVAVMQLFEQGKIGLDDPVYKYIPAYKDQVVLDTFNPTDSTYTTVPVNKPVTIRNLLTHTSGIIYGSFNPGKLMAVYEEFDMNVGFSHETWSTEEWINRLAKVPLAHQPGDRFSYGLNMDVLGRIIEIVSKQPLNQFFQENIFDKVSMPDTYFYLPKDKFDRLVPVYTSFNGKLMTVDELGMNAGTVYPKKGPRDLFAGGAGLSSTALDYANFINVLVQGGGDLLGKEALAEMTKNQMPMVINDYNKDKQRGFYFALGFQLYLDSPSKERPKSPGTYEWGGYFNTKFFIDPKEELIFVGMTQIVPFQDADFWDKMYALIYEAIESDD